MILLWFSKFNGEASTLTRCRAIGAVVWPLQRDRTLFWALGAAMPRAFLRSQSSPPNNKLSIPALNSSYSPTPRVRCALSPVSREYAESAPRPPKRISASPQGAASRCMPIPPLPPQNATAAPLARLNAMRRAAATGETTARVFCSPSPIDSSINYVYNLSPKLSPTPSSRA